ncbi:ABC transporter permease [Microbacterium esteraromaticum]|uniref:ABC transporter permease n=1 Tax=Microbacterium esteraromaticum TaxID=57043 RepID=UPI00236805C7|nr:ABC transporter permease [Microbacterium esteraromaticum]WDH78175.1 ABC transporter permease [Microbacterium esteraromaticum]
MTQLNALFALIGRNLRLARRRIDLLIQTMAVPVVVLGLASIIFGASDAWPIAVIDESESADSRSLIRTLDDTHGATGPYFDTITTDADVAEGMLRDGRLHAIVTIPPDFAETQRILTSTYNINTDAMKNVRLRLTTTANLYDDLSHLTGVSASTIKEQRTDVTRTAFMGGSAVILALLLGAALISANLYAVETEHRTRKEIALTPVGTHLAAAGAAIAGWMLSLVAAIPTVLLALAFGTRIAPFDLMQAALIVVPAGVACAGLGVLAAVGLHTHRLIQPVMIMLALGSYFASGGFIPVSGLPPLARTVAEWWPPTYVFEWANPVLHGFAAGPSALSIAAVLTAAAVTVGAAMWAARQDYRRSYAQGQ